MLAAPQPARVPGSRVAVVGGSIAGCAMAIALCRVGCEVTVFERSAALRDRGFGIGMAVSLAEEFTSAGYLDPAMPTLSSRQRLWLVRDDIVGPYGRTAWQQPFPSLLNNWGVLWRTLRAGVPAEVTWRTASVTEMTARENGAELTVDGRVERFDVLVGADGYRSAVRRLTGAGTPRYAGYSLWRGNYPASRLPSVPEHLIDSSVSVMFPGGHGACYLIPGLPGQENRVNWAIYQSTPPPGCAGGVASIPPGGVRDVQAAELNRLATGYFPAYWADVVRRTRRAELALQPVYDLEVRRYRVGRVLLAGDAGALARPHVGLGVARAIQDAMALERACRAHTGWDLALAGYDRDRTARGVELVELGRRLGVAQVDRTPPWETMSPKDFEQWWQSVVDG